MMADPEDDAPRLVYADWLEEHGGPADAARARFIRSQCRRARLDPDSPEANRLFAQEQQLLGQHAGAWRRGLPAFTREARYWRGFLDGVEVTADQLARGMPRLWRRE